MTGDKAPKVEGRTCALESCDRTFTPKRKNHVFCCREHGQIANNATRTYGIAPTAPVGEPTDEEVIRLAEKRGYIIHKPEPPAETTTTLDVARLRGKTRVRFGVVGCTHFGSKYQQVTALRDFARYAKQQKVDYLIHCGDVSDGPYTRHRNPAEVFLHDYDSVLEYAVRRLPKVGIPWLIIGGNHDSWWTLDGGPDIVKALCAARDDATYLGNMLGYIKVDRDLRLEVIHPAQGSAYARSYRLQKHIESLAPELKCPVVLMGNYHSFCAIYWRNVLGIQTASFQSQTPWMSSKSLVSEVSGLILEVGSAPKGIAPVAKIEVVYDYEPRPDDWP